MESTKYLLIGGGHASLHAAMAIRERDKEGRVLIVGNEPHPPYDRPPLSKQMLTNDEFKTDDPYSKFDNYYPDNNIVLIKGKAVKSIDRAGKRAALEDGSEIGYEKALIATGCHLRKLDVPGGDNPDLFYLRYIENSEGIRAALHRTRRAVVIGSSYMGMEAASGCLLRGIETTIVDGEQMPWSKFASPELGAFMRKVYEDKGAKFLLGSSVASISKPGEYLRVTTENGQIAEGNIAIACVGHEQNIALAEAAGLEVEPKKGVVADETLRTSDPSIWVAGDIAYYPDKNVGRKWAAQHFLHARATGKRAGANMAGDVAAYDQVPYFYSDFLDYGMILRGDPKGGKNTTVFGDMSKGHFVELYADDDGVLKMGVGITGNFDKLDPWSDKLAEIIRQKPKVADLKAAEFGL